MAERRNARNSVFTIGTDDRHAFEETSDQELAELDFHDDEERTAGSPLNLSVISGGGMIIGGLAYGLLSILGSVPEDLQILVRILPWVAALFILFASLPSGSTQNKRSKRKSNPSSHAQRTTIDFTHRPASTKKKAKRKLCRAPKGERTLFGVCGGIADYIGISRTLLRLATFVSLFFTGGITFLVYLGLAFVMPDSDSNWSERKI